MIKQLRVRFKEFSDGKLVVVTEDQEEIIVRCNDSQKREIHTLSKHLDIDSTLNLLYCHLTESGEYATDMIVYEPDYLIDISALAECFRPYGSHPLNYTLSRIKTSENTRHLLLGNAANFFMDELVNESSDRPVEYLSVLKKLFKISPFEYTSCEDLNDMKMEKDFFDMTFRQFNYIKYIVKTVFPKENIDISKIILEPSFICGALGVQGRLDILLQDYSAFVELKSGKGIEDFRTGNFLQSAINHYTQMILYLAVLEYNLELKDEDVRSFLLYSKYPVLSKEKHSHEHLQEAISLRNAIVATEYSVQKKNTTGYTQFVLSHLNSENLNTAKISGKFFDNYLRPQIDQFGITLAMLNSLEQTYFLRVYTFIVKELWLSKSGEKEYEGIKRASNLWSASSDEKKEAGELLYDLEIKDNQASSEEHFISLSIPEYDDFYLPNFRCGDAVVLYERNGPEDDVNKKQVFKGAIESIDNNGIRIRIRARQRNLHVLPVTSLYAVEHDYMDTVYTGMIKGLSFFAQANQDRKDLLLGKRNPDFDNNFQLSVVGCQLSDDISRVAAKAMAAKDFFLLIGPPGTGKTSLALKKILESCLENKTGNILLLAYTNRAVDEICKTLSGMEGAIPFIRIGSELNCALEYKKHLLDTKLKSCNRRSDVKGIISQCPVFVGTVASISNKMELFSLKQFDMAIIDEATQLLEPHLLGILSVRNKNGENAVRRFVLIGDHKQLPAVVLQTKEESRVLDESLIESGIEDLSSSLFERLYRKCKKIKLAQAYDQLSRQGRMHPVIAEFPSRYFYEGKLKCVGLPHQQQDVDELNNDLTLSWKDIIKSRLIFMSSKRTEKDKTDKINHEEALMAARLVMEFYNQSKISGEVFNPGSIGIITSYRNQIALIRKLLSDTGIPELSGIMTDTIERFQGSQKDIIIYSFCVNTQWQLKALPNLIEESGYLIDRKLNVALTRARKQLFILGNKTLLSQNNLYNNLLEHVEKCQFLASETFLIQ